MTLFSTVVAFMPNDGPEDVVVPDWHGILVHRLVQRMRRLLKPNTCMFLGAAERFLGTHSVGLKQDGITASVDSEEVTVRVDGQRACVEVNGAVHAVPDLTIAPYEFLVVDGSTVRRERLALPEGVTLVDWHVHTEFAYCCENVRMDLNVEVARRFGLSGVAFSEHSGHLYYAPGDYWRGVYYRNAPIENRMHEYLTRAAAFRGAFVRVGLELDCNAKGELVVKDGVVETLDHVIGAIHHLDAGTRADATAREMDDEFLFVLDKLLTSGVGIVAHPFRVYKRSGKDVPTHLFGDVARRFKDAGVAAEINFHTNDPTVDFITCCLNEGAMLAFGSDAHNLYEIGDFHLHLDLLERAGVSGDVNDVLFPQR